MAVNTLIQVRRGYSTEWTSTNPTLAAGEIGFETNTGKFKIGNGTSVWTSLGYASVRPEGLDAANDSWFRANVAAGSGIVIDEFSSGVFTISSSNPTIQVSEITDLTASAAELNLLDGVTATTAELNYVDITTAGTGQASKAVVLDANKDISGIRNLTLDGDLVVNGTTTTVNSTVVTLDDPILTLGGDTAPTVDDAKDRGILFRYFKSGSAKTGFFGFEDSTGKFTFIPEATNTGEVVSGTTGELDAKVDWTNILNKPDPVVTVTLTGDITGTASATLTDLASGTVTVDTTVAANSVALGTDTTGNYVAGVSAGSYATVSGSGSETATVTIGVDATDANTASKVVARDASGNFSAGTITATLSGTATNALNIEVDADTSTATTYVTFVAATNGNSKPLVNTNLQFNSASNYLLGSANTTPITELRYFKMDGGTP